MERQRKYFDDGGMMAKGGMTEMKIKGFSKKVPTFKSKVKGFDYKINKSVYDNFSDAQLTIAWYEFDLLVIGNIQFKVLETARYINDKFIDNNLPKADLLELSDLIITYRDYYNEIYKKFKKFENGGEMALGGLFDSPQKRSANRGRSWTLDHRQHNKGQSYETPLNKRKRKY